VSNTPDILKKIIVKKLEVLKESKSARPLKDIRSCLGDLPVTLGFETKLRNTFSAGETAIIAEVKKGSPSKGIIRADFDPLAIAGIYEQNGAACLSILTEEHFFMGSLAYLTAIREAVAIPLLRKDFIVDDYQIYEARKAGADAILLIAACLELSQLRDFHALSQELGLDVLLEVHDEWEMEVALRTDCTLVGVNNRNLRTFVTDLETTARLARMLPPERLLVSESGINSRGDIERLTGDGAAAFLIGESMMRESDIGAKLRDLRKI
jgi:indole-3-glycerol phosphate synthase